jgi:hypothetical protein
MYNFEQSKIVLVAVNSPSVVPPTAANDDNNTVGRDDTDGHPQSAPKLVWANDVVANANTADAANAILVINFFIGFIILVFKFPAPKVERQQKFK